MRDDHMKGQVTYRIGDVGRVVTGKTPPTADPGNFGADYPFLTPTDMQGTKWARSTDRGLSKTGASKLRSCVPPRSVAVSCIGWQMGKAILTDRPTYTNQQINTIIPNELADPDYLFYYFATRRDELLSIGSAGGVRTPIISKSSFEALEIRLPAKDVQRRIASILSAYDDLIENNTRRIAILEEMAKRIYEEWFVHFRFPGHESVRMVESKLGLVPEGWSIRRLGELISFQKGRKPSQTSKLPHASHVPILLIDALRGGPLEYAMPEKLLLVSESDTIMVMDGSGSCEVFVGHEGGIGSTLGRYRTENEDIGAFQLYLLFSTRRDEIRAKNIGAAIPHANKDFINSIEMVVPACDINRKFENLVAPMFALRKVLRIKNANLRATRDVLLPKLISGELDVSSVPEPEDVAA